MNGNVCVDASLILSWLLPAEQSEAADALFERWSRKNIRLITAPIFYAEVTSVLREQVYFGRLLPEEGEQALTRYLRLDVESISGNRVCTLAWELAKKFNLRRTYDMQYVAVAELRDCEMWTSDRKLINSLRGKMPRIRWAGEYE